MKTSPATTDPQNRATQATAPARVWVIRSYRAGENSQVTALADALGWPCEEKHLHYRGAGFIPNLGRAVSLAGIDSGKSDGLAPPWPDILISSGLRNEPVCRWVKQASGGHTKLVQIGRTWASMDHFDLVITTPQYRLADRPNVIQNHLTMNLVTPARLEQAYEQWQARFEHLPSPYVAVILGGNSGPYTLGARAARRLGREASRLANSMAGSLLITTSSRTSAAATEALKASLAAPNALFEWQAGAKENPYLGMLALADHIVVTGDSIAMLSEACATGKPVSIFDLGTGKGSMQADSRTSSAGSANVDGDGNDFRLSGTLYRMMMKAGPQRLSRDISLVHRWLIETGRANWLGSPPPSVQPPPLDEQETTAERVRALVRK